MGAAHPTNDPPVPKVRFAVLVVNVDSDGQRIHLSPLGSSLDDGTVRLDNRVVKSEQATSRWILREFWSYHVSKYHFADPDVNSESDQLRWTLKMDTGRLQSCLLFPEWHTFRNGQTTSFIVDVWEFTNTTALVVVQQSDSGVHARLYMDNYNRQYRQHGSIPLNVVTSYQDFHDKIHTSLRYFCENIDAYRITMGVPTGSNMNDRIITLKNARESNQIVLNHG